MTDHEHHTGCVVVMMGNAWGKSDELSQAIHNCFIEKTPTKGDRMGILSIKFPKPMSLAAVAINLEDGSIEYPTGSTTIKRENVPIPDKLIQAYQAWSEEMENFIFNGELREPWDL